MKTIITFIVVFCFLQQKCFCLTDNEIAQFKSRSFINKNSGVQGKVEILANDASTLVISSNGIPDHDTGNFESGEFGGKLVENQFYWVIPKNPVVLEDSSCLPDGPIAIARNGIPIYNPYSADCCMAGKQQLDSLDECWGRLSDNSTYNYITPPLCLIQQQCNQPSTLIGVALDGFPIYGPFDENGRKLTSEDLDECQGRTGSDGNYRYHFLPRFPYFFKCFKGITIGQTRFSSNDECKCKQLNEKCHYQEMNKRLGVSNENALCCKSGEQCHPVKNSRTRVASFESEEIQDKTTQTSNNIFSNLLQNLFNNNLFGWNSNSQNSVLVDSRSTSSQSSSYNRNSWFSSYSRNKIRNHVARGRGK